MQTAATTTVNRYDAIRDEINTRKEAVTNARNVPVDQHLEQYRGDVTGLAESKLDAYRRNSGAMRSYNEGVSVCACYLCGVCKLVDVLSLLTKVLFGIRFTRPAREDNTHNYILETTHSRNLNPDVLSRSPHDWLRAQRGGGSSAIR